MSGWCALGKCKSVDSSGAVVAVVARLVGQAHLGCVEVEKEAWVLEGWEVVVVVVACWEAVF
jgi:hypothetical protein